MNEDHRPVDLFGVAAPLLERTAAVATAALGLAGMTVLIGWIAARCYFGRFGASWIVTQLSTMQILEFGWAPVSSIALGCVLVLIAHDRSADFRKLGDWFFLLGLGSVIGVFTLVLLFAPAVDENAFWEATYNAASMGMFLLSLLFGYAFLRGLLAHQEDSTIREEGRQRRFPSWWALAILIGVVFSPIVSGRLSAWLDCRMDRLPKIARAAAPSTDSRLLALIEGRAYVTTRSPECSSQPVYVVELSEEDSIQQKGTYFPGP